MQKFRQFSATRKNALKFNIRRLCSQPFNYSSLSEKQQRDISNIMSASTSPSGSLAIQETEEVSLSTGNQQPPQQVLSLSKGPTYKEEHLTFR